MNDKPPLRRIRTLNDLADWIVALGLAGLDTEAIARVLRGAIEATPPPPARPQPGRRSYRDIPWHELGEDIETN